MNLPISLALRRANYLLYGNFPSIKLSGQPQHHNFLNKEFNCLRFSTNTNDNVRLIFLLKKSCIQTVNNVALTLVSSEQLKTLESNLGFLHNLRYLYRIFYEDAIKFIQQYL